MRPKTTPKAQAVHTTPPLTAAKNATLAAGRAAIVATGGTATSTAMTPPRNSARSPPPPGSVERGAAIPPAMAISHTCGTLRFRTVGTVPSVVFLTSIGYVPRRMTRRFEPALPGRTRDATHTARGYPRDWQTRG